MFIIKPLLTSNLFLCEQVCVDQLELNRDQSERFKRQATSVPVIILKEKR